MSTTTLALIAAWIVISLPLGIAAGFYLRARREQSDDELAQFSHRWVERRRP